MWWAWLVLGLWIGGFVGMCMFAWLIAAGDADDAVGDATEAEERQGRSQRSVVGNGMTGRPGGPWMVDEVDYDRRVVATPVVKGEKGRGE